MFGKKDSDSSKPNTSSSAGIGSINSLSEGTILEGVINTKSDIRIDGTIKGTLDCQGKLILGPSGYVDGFITCRDAVIEGKIVGTLEVADLLDVKNTAVLNCEIKTGQMRMQSGAVFNGKCQMGGQVLGGLGDSNAHSDVQAS